MAVEAIQEITQLEEALRREKEAAAARNKQRLLEAQRAARLLTEQSRQQAQAQAREMMARAEEQAGAWTREVLERVQAECEEQKARARKERLDQASAFLAEKVVSGWRS